MSESRANTRMEEGDDLPSRWFPPTDRLRFWTGLDRHGVRWLIKFSGGFCAVRERAFSVIAQALDISCQSSTFLKMPPAPNPSQLPRWGIDFDDIHQLAIQFLDEHSNQERCENCALTMLKNAFELQPYGVDVLRASEIGHAIDVARGQMLGMLCEMHEPPGRLVTVNHAFVQIDNELMFSRSAGAILRDSPWVVDGKNDTRRAGLNEAKRLCEQVLSLSDAVFQEAICIPEEYKPKMIWNVRKEIYSIRPRALNFLVDKI